MKHIFHYAPTIGILIFLVLFLISTTLYPGGSQANLNSIGFDWLNNYWCNLMNELSMNGRPNPAQPFAIGAMILLSASLGVFFFQFTRGFPLNKFWRSMTRYGGAGSMILASFMFTSWHDSLTLASSIVGLFAITGVLIGVANSSLLFYKLTAICCVLLLILNNVIYYSTLYLHTLPVLQKVTFAIVLLWVVGLNIEIAKRIRTDA